MSSQNDKSLKVPNGEFTGEDEAVRVGSTAAAVRTSRTTSANNVPGADYDVSKPVGSNHAAFPFGGMPH